MGSEHALGPDAALLADDGLRDWVLAVRTARAPSAESIEVDALRAAQRARAAGRPAGPAVHQVADLVAADRIPVRLYRPAADPRPVVLFAHGGGFVMVDLDSHDSTCRRLAATANVTVLSVGYRLAPEHPGPAAVEDVCEVYRWAARQDDLWGTTEVRRAALAGDSSGGAIAVLAAAELVSAGESPSALLLAYPNADMTLSSPSVEEKGSGWGLDRLDLAWFVRQWVPDAARRDDGRVSPLHADLAGLPPAVIATAEHDPLRDEGRALVERLRAAGVSVDHLHEGGLVHGFLGLGSVSPAAGLAGEELYARFARLLDQQEDAPGTRRRSADELDRYLDSVLIGGRETVPLVISDYDPAWPLRFAEIEARIRPALGDVALAVEHIGSTAVPGLAAKPIIDVLVVVADVEAEGSYVPPLQHAGFVLRVRGPGHRMFRTPERAVHIHISAAGDQAITDYLDLRDWLRIDESDRFRYLTVKRDLARRQWSDMNHYAEAKTEVIQEVLGRARAWRASS